MEKLVEEVKESCSAAVLDGADIVYVLRIPTHKIMSINLGIGSRLPAALHLDGPHAAGRAGRGGARRSAACAIRSLAHTARTLTDPARLKAELARVREQGWCLVDQELEEGLVSLSVPIRDRAGRAIAAMNISGQAARTSAPHMVEQFLPRLQRGRGADLADAADEGLKAMTAHGALGDPLIHLLNLLAAIALLVWSTHLVRTGMLRVAGENLRGVLVAQLQQPPQRAGSPAWA